METEFAACLLMVGPPDWISFKGYDSQPISTITYMKLCRDWYVEHVFDEDRHMPSDRTKKFTAWWLDYKLWLMKNRRGD